jgi:hypothetical protein
MDFDIHPDKWIEFFQAEPVLAAALLSLACGFLLTMMIKTTWAQWGNTRALTYDQFGNLSMWLGFALTWLMTDIVWFSVVGHPAVKPAHGLRHVVGFVDGIAALGVYWVLDWGLGRYLPSAAAWIRCTNRPWKQAPA